MILIADISVPSDAFPLGRILNDFPEVEIELERIVPLSEAIIPLFWIDGSEDVDAIEETLAADSLTDSVQRLTAADDRTLFEVRWDLDVGGLIDHLLASEAQVLKAEGTATVWDLRLQFRSREKLVGFRDACEASDIPVTLRRLYNPSVPADGGRLTDNQHEALLAAFEQGYYEVPRATSMETLAAEFDISDSALSQRLRRGTASLIADTLGSEL